jgi:hypothetical protein
MIAFDGLASYLDDGTSDHAFFHTWRAGSARIANAHLACLAAAAPFRVLAPSGVATIYSMMETEFESGRLRAGTGFTTGGVQNALYAARRAERPNTWDWRFSRNDGTIRRATMEHSFELLRALMERPEPPMALLRAELMFRATSALIHTDHSGALTFAWSAMEGMLGDLLSHYIDEHKDFPDGIGGRKSVAASEEKFISESRRDFLEGSAMTSRHTMELLSLLGLLPWRLYKASLRCAKARNNWLHKQDEASREVAILAIKALGELFELVEGVALTWPEES